MLMLTKLKMMIFFYFLKLMRILLKKMENADFQMVQQCQQPGTLLVKMESSAIKVLAKM
jgi:hypothetical protein